MARLAIFPLTVFVIIADRLCRSSASDGEDDSLDRHGYFARFPNQRLFSTPITSVHVAAEVDCIKNCVENERCYSFNLAIRPDDAGRLMCQLLASNPYGSSPRNLTPSKHNNFYSKIAAGPCLKSSCNHGACRPLSKGDGFVCECPTGFSGTFCEVCDAKKGWQPFQSGCYKFFPTHKTWDKGKRDCEDQGTNLLTIHSAEENDFVTETWLAQAGIASIALRDFQENDKFTWADNSTVDFVNWDEGEPNFSNEDCVHLYDNGKWNNYYCSSQMPYICETRALY